MSSNWDKTNWKDIKSSFCKTSTVKNINNHWKSRKMKISRPNKNNKHIKMMVLTNGLSISKSRSKILWTWVSSRKFKKKTMTILEMMISVFKTKNLNKQRAKQVLRKETIIYSETRGLQRLSRKNNKRRKVDYRSQQIWAQF